MKEYCKLERDLCVVILENMKYNIRRRVGDIFLEKETNIAYNCFTLG